MLSLCLLSACAPKPARVSSISQPSSVSQSDPARHARVRLLEEAHRAFLQARYPAAVVFFQRFTDIARDSPRLAEAHWWLGLAYEQLGDFPAAMAQYRLIAAGSLPRQADGALYEGRALRRLDELYGRPAAQPSRLNAQLAVRIGVVHLPPITHLSAWFQELAQAGVTAVALAPAMPGRGGFGQELVGAIVAEAHRHGLLLWVVFDLHQGHGLDIRPEWMVTTRHGAGLEETSASRVDVANPAYQSYLEEEIRMVARTGCDGVLLAARSTPGFADEFSAESLRAFAASFRLSPSPDEMFGPMQLSDERRSERSAAHWRWAGWKALSYANLVTRMRQALREGSPTAALLVEVHEASLKRPLEGLDQYGEDLAELAQRTGGALVVRRERSTGEFAFEKLGRQAGAQDRVWVGVGVKAGTSPPSMAEVKASVVGIEEYGRLNMLIEIESGQSLP